ncbi:MAG: hypothetical protein KGY99_01590 [Phycisphaerae bacterium]|nr:hypothetical protein [Phycisphaerae bacterium]
MIVADWVDDGLRDALTAAGLDTVAGAWAYAGGADLDKPGLGRRRRTRLELTDASGRRHQLYLKRYGREAVSARLRRAWTHGFGRGPARVEYENVVAARAAGVPTMRPVACGERDGCGCLLVTAVPGDALERCGAGFLAQHADAAQHVTAALATLVRALHGGGYVHRDLYASHVFLDVSQGNVALYLIDLARMFRPRWRRRRWVVKDLAALRYSMPAEWVGGQWEAFVAAYAREMSAARRRALATAVGRKARSIARHAARRAAREQGE